jgi:hypothetical protein
MFGAQDTWHTEQDARVPSHFHSAKDQEKVICEMPKLMYEKYEVEGYADMYFQCGHKSSEDFPYGFVEDCYSHECRLPDCIGNEVAQISDCVNYNWDPNHPEGYYVAGESDVDWMERVCTRTKAEAAYVQVLGIYYQCGQNPSFERNNEACVDGDGRCIHVHSAKENKKLIAKELEHLRDRVSVSDKAKIFGGKMSKKSKKSKKY